MVIDPVTLSLAASTLGGLFGGGGSVAPAFVRPPEQIQAAYDRSLEQGEILKNIMGAGATAPGVSVDQTEQRTKRETKGAAYLEYLKEKGYTPENAQKKLNQILSSKKKFNDDKEFLKWIRQGGTDLPLKVRKGRINASRSIDPAGVERDQQGQALGSAIGNLGLESLYATAGLPSMIGAETARALNARGGLANMATDFLGQGFTEDGLTPRMASNLDAMKSKYLNDFQDIFADTMRGATSQLVDSGFSSSSLAGEYLRDYAYKPQSDFLTDALAKLAAQEESMLTGRANRQTQNLGNILNSFNTLGANQGLAATLQGVISPSAAGLMNEAQSAQLAANLLQQSVGNYSNQFGRELDVATQAMTASPGAMSTLASGLGGAAGNLAAQMNFNKLAGGIA